MKRLAVVVVVLVTFFSCSIVKAQAGVAEDFFALSHDLELAATPTSGQSGSQDQALKDREQELSAKLLVSVPDLEKVIARAGSLERGLLSRLIARVKFEITQENRTALLPTAQSLQSSFLSGVGLDLRGKKKIANIYGREVDLMDGEWNTAPDGRRFWTSNEYPDIVLTPAEYRRYMATATTVED